MIPAWRIAHGQAKLNDMDSNVTAFTNGAEVASGGIEVDASDAAALSFLSLSEAVSALWGVISVDEQNAIRRHDSLPILINGSGKYSYAGALSGLDLRRELGAGGIKLEFEHIFIDCVDAKIRTGMGAGITRKAHDAFADFIAGLCGIADNEELFDDIPGIDVHLVESATGDSIASSFILRSLGPDEVTRKISRMLSKASVSIRESSAAAEHAGISEAACPVLAGRLGEDAGGLEVDVGTSPIDVYKLGAEAGFGFVFSDVGVSVLEASGNIRDGELYTEDDETGERTRMGLNEIAVVAPWSSFGNGFMHDILMRAFDRSFPGGIVNDIRMTSSEFDVGRDMSKDFIDDLLCCDIFDSFYCDGDSSYSYTHMIDYTVRSQLEDYGFPKDVYDKMAESPQSEEFSDDRHEALKEAYVGATSDAMTKGAEDACMSDFYRAIDAAVPRGVDADHNYDSGELRLKATREFVEGNVERVWEGMSDSCYDGNDIEDADILSEGINRAVIDLFNEEFDFREPYYGWDGFDERTFNESLSMRLDDAFGKPMPAQAKTESFGAGQARGDAAPGLEVDAVANDTLLGDHAHWRDSLYVECDISELGGLLLDDDYMIESDGRVFREVYGYVARDAIMSEFNDDSSDTRRMAFDIAGRGMLSVKVSGSLSAYVSHVTVVISNSSMMTEERMLAASDDQISSAVGLVKASGWFSEEPPTVILFDRLHRVDLSDCAEDYGELTRRLRARIGA